MPPANAHLLQLCMCPNHLVIRPQFVRDQPKLAETLPNLVEINWATAELNLSLVKTGPTWADVSRALVECGTDQVACGPTLGEPNHMLVETGAKWTDSDLKPAQVWPTPSRIWPTTLRLCSCGRGCGRALWKPVVGSRVPSMSLEALRLSTGPGARAARPMAAARKHDGGNNNLQISGASREIHDLASRSAVSASEPPHIRRKARAVVRRGVQMPRCNAPLYIRGCATRANYAQCGCGVHRSAVIRGRHTKNADARMSSSGLNCHKCNMSPIPKP